MGYSPWGCKESNTFIFIVLDIVRDNLLLACFVSLSINWNIPSQAQEFCCSYVYSIYILDGTWCKRDDYKIYFDNE